MSLMGRVVVVAGDDGVLDGVIVHLLAADALVAVVGRQIAGADAHVWFRTEPTDPAVWERVLPHVEQRLGPIDGAVVSSNLREPLARLLAADFGRRGHGRVIDVAEITEGTDVVRLLADTL